jgi:C-terminal processing protease CtpA/Prc
VVVVGVDQSSIAARKGLRPGDLITMVQVPGGELTKVASVKELKKIVKPLEKGDSVMVRVERGGHAFLVAFKIED